MSLLFLLLGFLSTMQIFKYQVFGIWIYLFDFAYYAIIVILISKALQNRTKKLFRVTQTGAICLIAFLVYNLFSVNLFSPIIDNAKDPFIWATIRFLIKKIIFFLFFVLIFLSDEEIKNEFVRFFVIGFVFSIIFHALYSNITSFYWYFLGIDIHTRWMKLLGITGESLGHSLRNFIYYPILRVTGFHWDPAYFGLWGVIALFYIFVYSFKTSTKIIISALIFIPLILTFSRSAFFALMIVTLIIFIIRILTKQSLAHYFNLKNFIALNLLLCIIVIPLMFFLSNSNKISFKKVFQQRTELDVHTQKHIQYPVMVAKALVKDPYHFVLGYGSRNSGRSVYDDIIALKFVDKNEAFDIESDLARTPANTGFIGLITYTIFISVILIELMRAYFKTKRSMFLFVFLTIATTFFGGFFYSYNDSIWVWIFYLIAVLILQRDNNEPGIV